MPPRSATAVRRSAAEWAARAVAAALILWLGWIIVANSLAASLKSQPAWAHAVAPGNGRITARLAQVLLTKLSPAEIAKAERLARLALVQDPTAVQAVAVLGIGAQARADVAQARRIFGYADILSRRDFQTQLWRIEDAVSRNDVAGALRHYDIALRTTRTAPDILYPVLAAAVSDPAIRSELTKTIAGKDSWGINFVNYLAENGRDPRAIALFFDSLRRAGGSVPPSATALATGKLLNADLADEAWAYYSFVRKGVARDQSRDPNFTADITAPTPFDWVPINTAGITASVQPNDAGGVFEFTTPPGVGGPVLQQVQLLPPGDYLLRGRSEEIDQPGESRPYWVLTCRDGRELGRVVLPNSAQNGSMFAGQFRVVSDCPVQTLALVARPSDLMAGSSGRISNVQLSRAR
jgi:hypothetical protein